MSSAREIAENQVRKNSIFAYDESLGMVDGLIITIERSLLEASKTLLISPEDLLITFDLPICQSCLNNDTPNVDS